MPTAPNPTPPTAEPSTGEPAPVYDTSKPANILNQYVEASKSSIGYVDHNYDSTTLRSPYYSTPVVISVPGNVVLDGVCPGRWSRGYSTPKEASDLSGGSGYFGYQDIRWWSTNFIDDGDSSCTMVLNEGKYYSKNTTVGNDTVLMGAITVEGSTVKLKWGSSWGVVTRNACFDFSKDGAYPFQSTTIPRLADGKVDTAALNMSVMKFAPTRGCFVMFDLSSNQVLYTMLDGEYRQMSASPGAAAPALQSRDATDPSSLPLSSKLTGLPVFTCGSVTPGGPGSNTFNADTTSVPQKTAKWLKFNPPGVSMDWGGDNIVDLNSDQLFVQGTNNVRNLVGYQSKFIGKTGTGPLRSISLPDPVDVYGGWLKTGTNFQVVGWLGAGSYLGVSPWGITSSAPAASVNTSPGFNLNTANVQSDILSRMPSGSGANLGFIYDASIGDYGRVTWISQL